MPAASRSAMLSWSASCGKAAAASHTGGVLVREPAPPYQEGWPEGGRDTRTSGFGPEIQSGGPKELGWCSFFHELETAVEELVLKTIATTYLSEKVAYVFRN